MKRFFIYAASFCASALMLTVSCQKPEPVDPDEPNPDGSVEFTLLSESEMHFSYQGGNDTIFYELKNAAADGVIDITPKDGWVGSFDTSVEGQIVFTVEENSEKEARNCTLRVAYTYGGNSSVFFDVVINQDAAESVPGGDGGEFLITIDESTITYTTADCHIEPADPEMAYMALVVEKSIVAGFVDDDEAWFEDDMNIYLNNASIYGLALRTYLEEYMLRYGTIDFRAASLTPSSDYWCYAYGVDFDDNDNPVLLTSICKEEFTTGTPASDPDDFVIEVSKLGETSVSILYIPYSDDVLYYFDNLSEEYHLKDYTGTIEERIEQHCYNYINGLLGYWTVEDFGYYGPYTYTFSNLVKEYTYYACAYILNDDGSAKDGKVWYVKYTLADLANAPEGLTLKATRLDLE